MTRRRKTKIAAMSAPRTIEITRRRLLGGSGVAGALWWAARPARAAAGPPEAYAGATSVKAGGTISFYVRDPSGSTTTARSMPMGIARLGLPDVNMLYTSVNVRNVAVPANASSLGCGWPVTTTVTIPGNWPSGVYYAVFGTDTNFCCVPFVVRPATRTAGVKVIVQVAVTTMQAYNNYGGKSLYAYNSSNGVPATQVSFNRPHVDPYNIGFDPWQPSFVRWLAKNGIAADFCTNIDLHADSAALTGYQLFLTAGHDEYWTREMRDRLDAMVAAGGNAAIFAGNTCWWQARLEAAGGVANRTLVCYKAAAPDPDNRAAYKTVNWIDLVPPYPENTTTGLGWNLGCSWTGSAPRPNTPYVVQRAEHWAFAGTGIASGASFGGTFVGYEADALAFARASDGRVYPTGVDKSPVGLRVLALADASTWNTQAQALGESGEKSGYAAIVVGSRGGAAGTIFNGGTIEWPLALQPELDGQTPTPFSRITANVIAQLSVVHRESVDVRQWRSAQANGDGSRYYYTPGYDQPAGAVLDGMVFRAYAASVSGTVPIYRYKYPQANGDGYRYLYAQNAALGYGWIGDGIAFYAYSSAVAGTVAVYQHHIAQANGDGWRMLYTPSPSVPGWTFDDVAFYAPTV